MTPDDKINIEKIRADFLDESRETMRDLHDSLTAFEAANDDVELLNEMFRLLHSLKGSAAVMGCRNLMQLAHVQEDLLDMIRKKRMMVSASVIKLLWEGARLLDAALEKIAEQEVQTGFDPREEDFLSSVRGLIASGQNEITRWGALDMTVDAEPIRRFFCDDVDVTQEVYFIRGFLKAAKEGVAKKDNTSEFLQALDDLMNKFDGLHGGDAGAILGKMRNDFASMVMDDGHMDPVLIQLLDENFQRFTSDLTMAEKGLDHPGVSGEPKGDRELVYRIEEKEIDALFASLRQIVTLAETLKLVAEKTFASENTTALFERTDMLQDAARKAMEKITDMKSSSLALLGAKVKRLAENLAEKAGKKVNVVIGECGRIDKIDLELIERILIHVVRNAIDHGLEGSAERIAAHKTETGTISIQTSVQGEYLCLDVADDGRGIDFDHVRQTAFRKGLMTQQQYEGLADAEVANWIFMPGMTTLREASCTSGRGVGLDVVKNIVEAAKGIIATESLPGQGTRFLIKLLRRDLPVSDCDSFTEQGGQADDVQE